jgi:hypothetical protein
MSTAIEPRPRFSVRPIPQQTTAAGSGEESAQRINFDLNQTVWFSRSGQLKRRNIFDLAQCLDVGLTRYKVVST